MIYFAYLWLNKTAYISFQQVRKGVNFQRWNLILYNNDLFNTSQLNDKNGEMTYLSFL